MLSELCDALPISIKSHDVSCFAFDMHSYIQPLKHMHNGLVSPLTLSIAVTLHHVTFYVALMTAKICMCTEAEEEIN